MATILMVLAEKKVPSKYEWIINFLTLGRRIKIYKYIRQKYLQENQFILDAGCGTGRFVEIADATWVSCLGIDISENMLQQAKMRFRGRKQHPPLIQTSITALPLRIESFDIVICTFVLSELNLQQVQDSLRELYTCLKKEGLLLLVTESKPESKMKRIFFNCIRIPAFLVTKIFARIPKHPVYDVKALLEAHSGTILEQKSYLGEHLTLIVYEKTPMR